MLDLLPQAFVARMKEMLGDQFDAFMQSYHEERVFGLRSNPLKIGAAAFGERMPFSLQPVPWCSTGYYYSEQDRPGKHPYYHAGLYYIQEPSAMAPVELLNVQPGDRVLDLCAAPGGKSTQIAGKLQGKGVLVTNDNHPERAKSLARNIELAGVRNACVMNELPDRLADRFTEYFDKILVDAPCSGEGMFRKEIEMVKDWARFSVDRCAAMQRDILKHAARMLRPGGTLVYSTCTFSPEENEGMIAELLKERSDFEVVSSSELGLDAFGFRSGQPDWLERIIPMELDSEMKEQLKRTVRIWPHLVRGEGHYVAVLKRQEGSTRRPTSEESGEVPGMKASKLAVNRNRKASEAPTDHQAQMVFQAFVDDQLTWDESKRVLTYGGHVYVENEASRLLDGLKVVRPGWYVGSVKNGRFTPSQPLAQSLQPNEAAYRLDLSIHDERTLRYLKGETLHLEADEEIQDAKSSWRLVCIDGFAIGWGKQQQKLLKNEYPAAWRWM